MTKGFVLAGPIFRKWSKYVKERKPFVDCDRVSFDDNLGPLILTSSCTKEVRVSQEQFAFSQNQKENFYRFCFPQQRSIFSILHGEKGKYAKHYFPPEITAAGKANMQ